jgi:uncharacterized protein YcgL (UPF0745 family)
MTGSRRLDRQMTLCKIYRSDRKAETYLYLANDCEFGDLPAELQQSFGEPAFVMQLVISPDRKLARVDVESVLENLKKDGFYLQLPPKLTIEEEISRKIN